MFVCMFNVYVLHVMGCFVCKSYRKELKKHRERKLAEAAGVSLPKKRKKKKEVSYQLKVTCNHGYCQCHNSCRKRSRRSIPEVAVG